MEKVKSFLHKNRHGLLMLLVGVFIAIFDLITKAVTDGKTAGLIDGFISIYSTHNTGAAWSMLNQHTWLLIILSAIFIGIIIFANYKFKSKNFLYSLAMGLILGGAFCNLFDRVAFGYVRDFISLEFMDFPIFNIADCAITVGVILIVIFFVVLAIKENKQAKIKQVPAEDNGKIVKVNDEQTTEENLENLKTTETASNNEQVVEEKQEKTELTKKTKVANGKSVKKSSISNKNATKTASKSKKTATKIASNKRKTDTSKSKNTKNSEAK